MQGRRFGLIGFILLLSAGILVPFALLEGTLAEVSSAALQQTSATQRSLVVVGLLAADILLPIPSSVVMVGAAIALPPVLAFVSCFVGLMLGCGLGYILGRRFGEPLLARMATPERRGALSDLFSRHGVGIVAVCRPIPMLAELSIVMAGSASAPLIPFLAASTAANAAVAAVYVALGSQVSDTATFLAAFAAACLVPALGWLLLKILTRKRAQLP